MYENIQSDVPQWFLAMVFNLHGYTSGTWTSPWEGPRHQTVGQDPDLWSWDNSIRSTSYRMKPYYIKETHSWVGFRTTDAVSTISLSIIDKRLLYYLWHYMVSKWSAHDQWSLLSTAKHISTTYQNINADIMLTLSSEEISEWFQRLFHMLERFKSNLGKCAWDKATT